jgi:ATP-binding cassette subfamily F protein uup
MGPVVISAQDLSLSFDDRVLFSSLSVGVDAGERLALVGQNGVGKSTLLRLLAGQQRPESGRVDRRAGARVGLLAQEPHLDDSLTAHQVAAQGLRDLVEATREYHDVTHRLAQGHGGDAALQARQADLLARVEHLGGFDAEHRVDRVLSLLGVKDPNQRVADLSGGGKRRVALAALMVEQPEVLLLDEPTNHLDRASMTWLVDELRRYKGAVIFITHDRAFLDDVATRVAELADSRLYVHGATYTEYLEGRLERLDLQARTAHRRERYLARELSWLRAGTPARTTKQQARIKRAEDLLAEAAMAEAPRAMVARRQDSGRLAKTVLELRDVTLGYPGREVLRSLTLLMVEGMRVGIVGPNGSGKTTLLRAITGELPPLSGTITHGEHTSVAYFDQHRETIDDDVSVRDALTRESHVDLGGRRVHVHGYLEGYLFRGDDLHRPVRSLSGGERNRLLLARLMLKGANLLLMDEPTNDLDHDTLGVLEEVLVGHPGCALVASHDARFLDRVATNILAIADDGTCELFPGNHAMYLTLKAQREAREPGVQAPSPAPKAARERRATPTTHPKLTFKEQRELDAMEGSVVEAEEVVARLQREVQDPAFFKSAGARAQERVAALEAAQAHVASLYARWDDLNRRSELAGRPLPDKVGCSPQDAEGPVPDDDGAATG